MAGTWVSRRTAEDRSFRLKLALRIISTVATLASLIAAVSYMQEYFAFFYASIGAAWGISLIWNVVWASVMVKRERPIVPGLIVGLDLIIWGYYAWISALGWLEYAEVYYVGLRRNRNGSYPYNVSALGAAIGAASFFVNVVTVAHFWLFVLGCMDEDRRRKALRQTTSSGQPTTSGQHTSTVKCVDCHAPVQVRCVDCQASVNTGNRITGPPDYYTPKGQDVVDPQRASYDSVEVSKYANNNTSTV